MLNLVERQVAIKSIKDYFELKLSNSLNLLRVSAPLFVRPETGLNDNLTGVEKPVSFLLQDSDINVEVVQSLAKWKRFALQRYGMKPGEGLYTDMNAIRPFEKMDSTHSIYVDQWDWELVLQEGKRNERMLLSVVDKIYEVFKMTENKVNTEYNCFQTKLPSRIFFIDSQELYNMYPNLSAKEREDAICQKYKAVFLQKIGAPLSNGESHDKRSPDYDDWNLNGDILFWNPVLESSFEVSSMGIRVDSDTMRKQLLISGCENRMHLEYHRMVMDNLLPLCIGGGIGQSRICMYFLESRHIGEVQASVWNDSVIEQCNQQGIFLL